MDDLVEHYSIDDKYSSTGKHSGFQVDLYHSGLDEHKHLSALDHGALLGKIHNQKVAWQKKWEKELHRQKQQSKEEIAKSRTEKALVKLEKIESILEHTLTINDAIDWETLKNRDEFCWKAPSNKLIKFNLLNNYPEAVSLEETRGMPKKEYFFTDVSFFQKLFGKEKKIRAEQQEDYDEAVALRIEENQEICKNNKKLEAMLSELQRQWEKEKSEFVKAQYSHNQNVDELKAQYQLKDLSAIMEYCEMVLNNSEYPDNFPRDFELHYNDVNGMLIVDFQLPSTDCIPTTSSARFVKSRNEIVEKKLSQTAVSKLYDSAIYQIVLRTIHELFEADTIDALSAINLNGYVTATNPASGHQETNCIVTIQAKKEEFEAINLEGIVANQSFKQCFKSLKGVGSTKLSTLTAVQPILEFNKEDKRFKEHYEVADGLNLETNLAAMDWEDFEHLVREVFEREFIENGGEVKVTQASADGGVDAVAFDPDPIRGGKIVIQAKRYTNVVGVAAVRDLYGTVLNEGAIKGILVTTSDYGSDSYNFAKDKPITLLNGSNLLHLLEKHGHKAKIDIKKAKQVLKEQAI